MGQFQQLLAHRPCTIKLMPMPMPMPSASLLPINAAFSKLPTSSSLRLTPPTRLLPISAAPSRFVCKMNGSVWLNFNPGQGLKRHQDRLDLTSQLELGKSGGKWKPQRQVNGIFWIILLNLGIFVADHLFQVRAIKTLYLYHNWPAWYQFVTATFCHANCLSLTLESTPWHCCEGNDRQGPFLA
ncbi:rhomboid-like protein 11, chloroplastic isoform X3 [Vitis riparia]|uniref:rhomboid-like protein 11, chloroplastic isoform X3 n=1 Tax=Vitis riparia TaxID=96939 RepID=UPI00155B0B3A|nr:rhomboid-like protein 11, chloroplastic isoform X3 [Vitis riparia]